MVEKLLSVFGVADEEHYDLLKPLAFAVIKDIKKGGIVASEFLVLLQNFTSADSKAWPSQVGMVQRMTYAPLVKMIVSELKEIYGKEVE